MRLLARSPALRARPVRAAFALGASAAGLALGVLIGCTEEVRLGENFIDDGAGAGAGGSPPSGPGGAGNFGGAGEPPAVEADGSVAVPPPVECVPVSCRGIQQCGDCLDNNDGDGLIDANDPECLGPCDNSEAELFTGIETNVTGSCRIDCYFDGNSGGGGDGCSHSFFCDQLSVAPDFSPSGRQMCAYDEAAAECAAPQDDQCLQECLPLVPNGCDCFGCCEVPAMSERFVWLGSAGLERPCTPDQSCLNECADCELCVGKPTLPDSCRTAGGPPAQADCPAGRASCNPELGLGCGGLEYCITGCCVPSPR